MAMKESETFMEQVAGITECPICSDKLINNRLLPCGHTFCLKCLEQYKKQNNQKGKSLPCPMCRKEFAIPKGGCSALAKNFALEQLTGVQKSAKDSELAQCDVCDNDRRMVAVLFCLQCEQNMCVDCERTHKKMKSTSTHHVLPVSKKDQLRHLVDKRVCCREHDDQRLELVCTNCKEAICWKCKSLTHHAHNCVEINEVADQCVEQLKLNFEEAENRILMLSKISANIKDKIKQQQDIYEREKSKIAKISADMIRTIVANEDKLVKELELFSMRTSRALKPQEERLDKQLEDLRQHKTYVKQIVDCGQPWEIYRCTSDLHNRTVELLKLDIVDIDDISFPNLSDLQIREHLISNKPEVRALFAENKNKQPPPTALTKPTTSTTTVTVISSNLKAEPGAQPSEVKDETKKKSQPQTPSKNPATSSMVTATSSRSGLDAESSTKTCDMKRKSQRSFAGGEYANDENIQQQTSVELTFPKKKALKTSLSEGQLRLDYGGYDNMEDQQMTRVAPNLLKRNTIGASIYGTLRRNTDSDWSNASTVGKIAGDGTAIIGVTILKLRVYFIRRNSSQIQVYHSITLNKLPEFKLEAVHEPKELTSCAVNNCLYLSSLNDQAVYKADINGGKILLTWKTDKDSCSISTTKDGNVILAGFLKQTLKEYTTHGILLRVIILKPDIGVDINPWLALKLESGNYLICHGKSRVDKHRVCMITPDGDVVKSFGDERGWGISGLFGPYYLALDGKKNILVADCNNCRIVVLSPNLQYLTEYKTNARFPARFCIDSATGTLYVANNDCQDGKRTDGQIVALKPNH